MSSTAITGTTRAGRNHPNRVAGTGTSVRGTMSGSDKTTLLCSTNAAPARTSRAHSGHSKKCASNCSCNSGVSSPSKYFSAAIKRIDSLWSISTFPPRMDSAKTMQIVSISTCRGRGGQVLQIHGLKCLFGAMQQNPEIVPVYAKVPAYGVFVAFFEKYLAQQSPVAFRKFIENLADLLFHFFMRENGNHVQRRVWHICAFVLFAQILSARGPIMFEQYVIAN